MAPITGPKRSLRNALSSPGAVLLCTFAVVWAVWEVIARSGLVYEGVVPSSLHVMRSVVRFLLDAAFYHHLGVTSYEVLVGAVIGAVAGFAVGLALGIWQFLGRMGQPYIHYLAPAPKIVFLPILMILFGIGSGSKIAMGAISCFFPMVVATVDGIKLINPVFLRVATSFNATLWQKITKIYMPSLLLPVVIGLRLGIAVAIVGTLLAEIKLSNQGLGYLLIQQYNLFRIADMYAVLLITFLIAVLINLGLDWVVEKYDRGK